jgi:putative membrane protein
MVRLLISIIIRLVANGLGLAVAARVLDDMTLTTSAFFLDVVIFTAVVVIAQPVVLKAALKHSDALMGSSALIAAFIALVITAWLSDGLQITGTATWLLATVIVWAASLLAGVLLPAIFVKRGVQEARR